MYWGINRFQTKRYPDFSQLLVGVIHAPRLPGLLQYISLLYALHLIIFTYL